MRLAPAALLLTALSLTACASGGGTPDAGTDASTSPDSTSPGPDGSTPPADASTDTSTPTPDASATDATDASAPPADGAACTVSTMSFGNAGALSASVNLDNHATPSDPTDDVLSLVAPISTGGVADALSIQLYAGIGIFSSGTIPAGTYPLTGDKTQYATCAACVQILTRLNSSSGLLVDNYLVTGGTLTLTTVGTAAGQRLTGSVSNLTLQHVHLLSDGSQTSVPAGDGCTTTLSSATFDTVITAAP